MWCAILYVSYRKNNRAVFIYGWTLNIHDLIAMGNCFYQRRRHMVDLLNGVECTVYSAQCRANSTISISASES